MSTEEVRREAQVFVVESAADPGGGGVRDAVHLLRHRLLHDVIVVVVVRLGHVFGLGSGVTELVLANVTLVDLGSFFTGWSN